VYLGYPAPARTPCQFCSAEHGYQLSSDVDSGRISSKSMQLKVIHDTFFKQSTANSTDLPPQDKVAVPAGQVFRVHSCKRVGTVHLKVALLGVWLGNPPRNTWHVYIGHIQVFTDKGQSVLIPTLHLQVTHNTVFKQSTTPSSQLPPQDKISVAAGQMLKVHSCKLVDPIHLKVAFMGPLGNPPRNTWHVYTGHIQLISSQGKVIPLQRQPTHQTPNAQSKSASNALPASKQLNVPYLSQLDNRYNPTGACNVTSFAMVMAYFQIRGRTSAAQLEDELYQYMLRMGLSRHDPHDLATMSRAYGLRNDFTTRGSLADIRKAIAEGRPCIIHGYFTSFGHIIVVRGYDQQGFRVNDPYGEWSASGYNTKASGANLHYSNSLIQRTCSPEGPNYIWLHQLAKA